MPQLSPVSWVSVFIFLVGMMVNMSIINWWYKSEYYYEMKRVGLGKNGNCSHMFVWGKNFVKV
uniref:ATP synthase F0 subunit 8 n=1 Tax=Unio crassus TaxID=143297 RepID=A0A1Q1MMM7_9BIVA|nr:ATP synthase F0 subunit 8 [Unio crassus]